jgi:YVTN family beta-propeller protein
MSVRSALAALGVAAAALAAATAAAAAAAPAYTLAKTVPLGAPDRWDYVVVDSDGGRVYVAHGDRLEVLDARSGARIGAVTGIPGGTHGTAVSLATGQGFTDDGEKAQAVAFDLKTLKVTARLPADQDADAVAGDPATGRIFVMNGDSGTITVVYAKTDKVAATIKVGEKLETAVPDGQGSIYLAGAGNRELLKIDARTNRISARWAIPDCTSPHGLALDTAGRRAFVGCLNSVMMVVDTQAGKVVAQLPIGAGSDALAWDAKRKRVFSSNGKDGTITVYQQVSPDRYQALAPIKTVVSARTMGVDPASGRLFVAAADVDPAATPGGRPRPRPGSFKLLILDPAK